MFGLIGLCVESDLFGFSLTCLCHLSLVSMLGLPGLYDCVIGRCFGSHWSLYWVSLVGPQWSVLSFNILCWISMVCVGFHWSLSLVSCVCVGFHCLCFVSLISMLGLAGIHVAMLGLAGLC